MRKQETARENTYQSFGTNRPNTRIGIAKLDRPDFDAQNAYAKYRKLSEGRVKVSPAVTASRKSNTSVVSTKTSKMSPKMTNKMVISNDIGRKNYLGTSFNSESSSVVTISP